MKGQNIDGLPMAKAPEANSATAVSSLLPDSRDLVIDDSVDVAMINKSAAVKVVGAVLRD